MKHIRLLTVLLFLLSLAAVFTVCTSATEEYEMYYYVDAVNGSDDFNGTSPSTAVKTFSEACRYAAKSQYERVAIVFIGEYTLKSGVTKGIAHDNHFTFTTNDGITDYGAEGAKIVFGKSCRFNIAGPTAFENITFDFTSSITFVGNYHETTFGENVQFNKLTEEGKGVYVYGGYRQPVDTITPIDKDAHLTINSGNYYLVVGGSKDLGKTEDGKTSGHIKFQNTNHLTINGGTFDIVYGGTHTAHAALNVDVTVNGGKINRLNAAGDATRRAYGDGKVTLNGGEIGEFIFNNIVGAGSVAFNGTKIAKASLVYASTEIEGFAATANKKKVASYDGNFYTDEEVAMLTEGYDTVVNATYIYAKENGRGSGSSEAEAASFKDAFAKAVEKNAVVKIIGSVTVDSFTEPAHSNKIIVIGSDSNAKLTLNGNYTLGGEIEFSGITLTGNANVNATGGTFIVAADAKTSMSGGVFSMSADNNSKLNISGSATLHAGTFGTVTNVKTLIVDGATVDSVVLSGEGDATVSINKGEIKSLVFRNMQGETTLQYVGGKISATAVEGDNKSGAFVAGSGITANMLGDAAVLFTKQAERVVFAMDGATGSGVSAVSPASFADAYASLTNGGTLVIVGEVKATAAFYQAPAHSGKVTITSLYDGVDYRAGGARIVLPRSFYFGGDTDVDHVNIVSQGENAAFFCFYHDVTFGKDISGSYEGSSTTYPCIVTGSKYDAKDVGGTVTVNGGDWQRLRLGNSGGNPSNVRTDVIVNGGDFHGYVYMISTSHKTHSGTGSLTVNGGNFYSGILGAYYNNSATVFDGSLTLTINGGTVYNVIQATNKANGVLSGSFTLVLQNGDFSHLTDIAGIGNDKFTCSLQTSELIDLNAKLSGTYAYTNNLRGGADPFLFYHDGCYYYTSTVGSAVRLYKAANFGDFKHGVSTVIYDPEDDKEWGKNLWAPELHYYSAEEVGAANAGWYLYIGGSNVANEDASMASGQRLYVLKCLTDDLQGRWGHPITGEVNVPAKLEFPGTNYNTTQTTADASVVRIGSKPYLTFFTTYRAAETDGKPYQAIVLAEVENPWTFPNAKEICHPDYEWEKGGSNEKYPMVVEGPSAIYAPDGTTYIGYSGSGYWTAKYCLGALRYIGGNPTEKSSWEKLPEPFLAKSEEIVSCGHASYFTSPDGKMWICYHGRYGDATGDRHTFVEPMTADKNGIKVGNGSGTPAPASTVWTVNVNPQPIADKISGFATRETVASTRAVVKLTIGSKTAYINGAAQTLDAAPINRNNRTMLPVRFLANAFGVENDGIKWDAATRTATLSNEAVTIVVTIDAPSMTVNGETVALDSPAIIDNNRTFLPVRAIANALGVSNNNIKWDGATSTATLIK